MFQIANTIMRMSAGFLGAGNKDFWEKWYNKTLTDTQVDKLDASYGWVVTVYNTVMTILVPILAIVGAAGILWAIVLGVQMARADSTDRREEVKKRLIGLIVGIVILVILIIFFTTLFPMILSSLIKLPNPS